MQLQRPSDLPRFNEPPARTATAGPTPPPASHGPDYRNVEGVLMLSSYRALNFNGRVFRVPPIPWPDGVRVLELSQRLDNATAAQNMDEYQAILAELTELGKRLLIPCGWRRYLWHLHIRPNYLKRATEKEMGGLLGFFYECRTNGRLRLSPEPTRPDPTR